MNKYIFILLSCTLPLPLMAQFTADDLIRVQQKNSRYPGFVSITYQDLPNLNGGHTYMWMRNYGGTPAAPKATPANRLLGTVIYSGHDGTKDVQIGRIGVVSTGSFSTGEHPVRMDFSLGGSTACCGATRMSINGTTGNVGIGTSSPRNKLDVNGTIRGKEVKVEAAPWPDYVFKADYALPSLHTTEAYIQEHGHLPQIPSAKEVENNGIALGEMNAKLLQKIEELTLHLIAQDKKNAQQSRKITALEKENRSLKALSERVSAMEVQLKATH